ncbi:hypothetical protein AA101099_0204 [Neoasaia chiangmaiensis NBRC 101099]|uniref:Uncharacterized protein n=1 Tax=Neoasaia chiangmaiensis TaxID=320497 RepID=A0A1U9KRX1_9PROT|nr:hypothetical protein [Neoasaia chiangmaiensis]AQS88634.1 hypothetical protein A0U93_12635 [Neoasaia chiangmaiensis]GBR35993.1 hypothetical protein AA101099_0204 [Neoasaia chiangmaiensis NBRC 101099]GEN15504.1 hypothetical protein NCH01_19350 [Neoasaia chiangmaiensis]
MDQQNEATATSSDPADRLESALNRIAYALDRRAAETEQPDLQTLAANIDALRARVRDALAADESTAEED